MSDKTIRCITCGAEFSDAEIEGVTCCPNCKSTGIPCDIADDVSLKINWHELRILAMWSDNYAQSMKGVSEDSKQVVARIIERLEKQYPDKTPLTLAGEVRQLQETYPGASLMRENGEVLVPPKKVQ